MKENDTSSGKYLPHLPIRKIYPKHKCTKRGNPFILEHWTNVPSGCSLRTSKNKREQATKTLVLMVRKRGK